MKMYQFLFKFHYFTKFVPMGQINNISALVQKMARCRSKNKLLSETMMIIYRRIYASLDGLFWPSQFIHSSSRWRHQMETFSALLALCAGNSPVTGEFPAQTLVTRSFDIFLDQRLSKQSLGWWFETPSRSLWRQCNYGRRHRFPVSRTIRVIYCFVAIILFLLLLLFLSSMFSK